MSLVNEYLSNWVSPDGGGMIDPGDRLPPFEGAAVDTTKNENPILFLVQAVYELFIAHPNRLEDLKRPFVQHMEATRVEPGLHSRRPGDAKQFRQSHDNLVAMFIGSWLFNTAHRHEIFAYGSMHGWNFNVGEPGRFQLECQMQGGDVAIAHLACGKQPSLWLLIWLGIGLAISTTWNLADLRIKFLEHLAPAMPAHSR
ncbi:MAG: hypothetical protein HC888_13895 [Candidatus Competibacteraceae bacterium]|nr:hypothetical protein [Candidatus Competibacteraceae bacterium]